MWWRILTITTCMHACSKKSFMDWFTGQFIQQMLFTWVWALSWRFGIAVLLGMGLGYIPLMIWLLVLLSRCISRNENGKSCCYVSWTLLIVAQWMFFCAWSKLLWTMLVTYLCFGDSQGFGQSWGVLRWNRTTYSRIRHCYITCNTQHILTPSRLRTNCLQDTAPL
jgi:hypothetical protein